MKTITFEQLADKLNGKIWTKGDLKRIYLDEGFNTKKMSTKTYVYERQDGSWGVSCRIECPSQNDNWISSQEDKVIESVENMIEEILATVVFLIVNRDGEVVNNNNKVTSLNNLYDSEYFINKEQADKKLEEFPSGFSLKSMDKVEFENEVERLNQIEKNLTIKDKLERGDEISFSKNNTEGLISEIKNEEIEHLAVILRVHSDRSGAIVLRTNQEQQSLIDWFTQNPEAPEQPKPQIPVENVEFGVGSTVNHSNFGNGTVVFEDEKKIVINFPSVGEKSLLKQFAKLTLVNE